MTQSTMNDQGGIKMEEVAAWIGVDWADQQHQVCEYNAATDQTSGYIVKSTPQEVQKWLNDLRSRYSGAKVAVVMEQARGSLLYALMGCDFLVIYPVNPANVANYRKAFYPSGAKSDPGDAELMTEMARKHQDKLRVWRPDDPETRSLRLLAEGRRKQVNQITRLTNQLTAQLKVYYPQALDLAGELSSLQACDFLDQWPNLGALKEASPTRLRNFYKRYGRPRKETIEERIKQIKAAIPITEDRAAVLAGSMMVQGIVAQIRAVIATVANFDIQIAELFQKHPDCSIFKSFPGAGPALAPRLLAAFGADRDRWESADDIQKLSGIAPVTRQSGKTRTVSWRFACPKFLRQTFHEYAAHSIVWCDWAKAFYQAQRRAGKEHHTILRALAFKWIRIMYRCWKARTRYDDSLYLNSLELRKSPLSTSAAQTRVERQERKRTRKRSGTQLPLSPALEPCGS